MMLKGSENRQFMPKRMRPRHFGLPQANSSLFERVILVYLGRWHEKSVMKCMLILSGRVELIYHGKSVMTCMLVFSGRVELMVMHDGV